MQRHRRHRQSRSANLNPRAGKMRRRALWGLLLLMAAAGTTAVAYREKLGFQTAAPSNFLTEVVSRRPLDITVTARGSLDSASNVQIASKVEGATTIISIVPEGTSAKAGQVLVELDSSKLRDQATQQQIVSEQADAALKQAIENLAIQKTQNDSDIAAAELKLKLADLDLEKYKKGEYEQLKSGVLGKIRLAEENYTRAKEQYEFSKRLSKKGYVSQAELEANRIAVTKAEVDLRVAKEEQRVLDEYDYFRQIAEKEANAREFKRELERVKRKATAALAQAEADLSARKLTAEVERSKLEKLREQIAACTITAPQDGEVVYANSSDRRSETQATIMEGASVRERQAIINLPDFSRMQVNTKIHESRIGLVRDALAATVQVDAVPGTEFNGIVSSVSSVPISGNWRNPDLKEYNVVIKLTDAVEKVRNLKPGLTADVTIHVDHDDSVLQVPVQAVVEFEGQHWVFVIENGHPVRKPVELGRTNDIVIELLEPGSQVREGQRVALNPRSLLPKEEPKTSTSAAKTKSADGPDAQSKSAGERPETGPQSEGDAGPRRKQSADQGAGPDLARGPGGGPNGPRPGSGGPGGAGPGGGGPGGARPGGGDPSAFFARLDKDSDGKIVKADLPERLQANFDKLDANADGSVDLDEFKAGAAQGLGRPGGGGGPGGGTPGGPRAGGGNP